MKPVLQHSSVALQLLPATASFFPEKQDLLKVWGSCSAFSVLLIFQIPSSPTTHVGRWFTICVAPQLPANHKHFSASKAFSVHSWVSLRERNFLPFSFLPSWEKRLFWDEEYCEGWMFLAQISLRYCPINPCAAFCRSTDYTIGIASFLTWVNWFFPSSSDSFWMTSSALCLYDQEKEKMSHLILRVSSQKEKSCCLNGSVYIMLCGQAKEKEEW